MTKKLLAVFLALVYTVAYIVVGPMVKAQYFSLEEVRPLSFILCFAICSAVNILILCVIPKKDHYRIRKINERMSKWLEKFDDRRLFFIVWAFIFIMWLPAYLILYPGVLSYDMISQTTSALGEITNNHHPVLHTWLIRVFMRMGEKLFSSYESGIGLLSLLQMIILSYALSRMVMLLKKKAVPILLVIGTVVLSAVWFMNACLSVTMIKDTLHAAFLVLFCCHFVEIATNPSEYIARKRNLVLFPIVSFFMCAFRNNGLHIYLFCFAILLVLRISRFRRVKRYLPLIAVVILPVIMFKIYTGPVFDALGIEPGQVREALSIPIQQLQRVAVKRAGELTPEQTEMMGYYIDDLEWRSWSPGREYDPFISDPAKSCFISSRYEDAPIAFWKFYLQTGKQFSKEYLVAFLSNTLGYWYPGYYDFSYVMYDNYPSEMFPEPLERKSILKSKALEGYYESLCSSDFWRSTWGVRIFFVSGFAPWILIFAVVLSWRKKGFFTMTLPLFLPLIAQYGIMLLSPMSSFRYSWPYYLMLPLTFIAIFTNKIAPAPQSLQVAERHGDENENNCI